MRRMMKKSSMLAVLFAAAVLIGTFAFQTTAQAASAKLNKKKVTLSVGMTETLKVKGTKAKVKWTTSKKSVATVSSKGKITAKKTGTATITAKVGKQKLTCKVTVKDNSKTYYTEDNLDLISTWEKIQKKSGTSHCVVVSKAFYDKGKLKLQIAMANMDKKKSWNMEGQALSVVLMDKKENVLGYAAGNLKKGDVLEPEEYNTWDVTLTMVNKKVIDLRTAKNLVIQAEVN